MRPDSKIYLVTGAGHRPGIGSTVVQELLSRGDRVIVNSRSFDADWLDQLCRHDHACVVQGDITTGDCQDRLFDAIKHHNRLDGLIHNASTGPAQRDHRGLLTEDCWAENFLVNCTTVYSLTHRLKHYLDRTQGCLVTIASRASVLPGSGNNMAYAVSKSAMVRLTQELALELGPNIRANSVSPGLVLSQRFQTIMGDKLDQALTRWQQQSGMTRAITPKEVSDMVMMVLQTPSMTGQNLVLAGQSTL